MQGYTEHFLDSCEGPIGWIAASTLYLAFAEGWALYAENPLIPEYTKIYEVDPISKYGMLKWQVCSVNSMESTIIYTKHYHTMRYQAIDIECVRSGHAGGEKQ